ncbi:copper chaperone PCu(A)C [Pseudothioclava arenosa]|nr:copper chaperone PCu(A)C [Pseudothioclava arenosa]
MMISRRSVLAALAATGLSLALPLHTARAEGAPLEISGGFLRASPGAAKIGAGFVTIRSKGEADRLIGFRSPACARPELHTHVMDNGMMRMRQVEAIEVPAGGEAVLEPGGLHLMFIDLTAPLAEGDNVPVTLIFEKAGEIEVSLPVKSAGAMK